MGPQNFGFTFVPGQRRAGLLLRSVLPGAHDPERQRDPGNPFSAREKPREEDDLRHGSKACVPGIPEVLPQTRKGGERDVGQQLSGAQTEGTESGLG